MSEENDGPPVYSIVKETRLVAYAKRELLADGRGAIRRASGKVPTVLEVIDYAVIDCFDAKLATVIVAKAKETTTLDGLLFELKLEGFEVHEGEIRPHGGRWSF